MRNGSYRNTLAHSTLRKTPPAVTKPYKNRHQKRALPIGYLSPPSPSIGFRPLPRMALNCDGVMPVVALNCALR